MGILKVGPNQKDSVRDFLEEVRPLQPGRIGPTI